MFAGLWFSISKESSHSPSKRTFRLKIHAINVCVLCMLVIGSFYRTIHVTKCHLANKINKTNKRKRKLLSRNYFGFGFFHLLSNFFSFFSRMVADIVKNVSLLLLIHRHSGGDERDKKKKISEKKKKLDIRIQWISTGKLKAHIKMYLWRWWRPPPQPRLVIMMALCYFVGRINKQPTKIFWYIFALKGFLDTAITFMIQQQLNWWNFFFSSIHFCLYKLDSTFPILLFYYF